MNAAILIKELRFKTSRSSGAGGQHVNKVASRVTLVFDLMASAGLTADQKFLLQQKLDSRLTKDNILTLHCEESRSQHRNKELVIRRFLSIINTNLSIPKKRRPTKPSKTAVLKRLDNKRRHAEKKSNRRRSDW